ncbi:MAG: glycosyltransferase family 4 protein [Patescibacteria group bacterium]|jgi:glycosyltransferase involved in cell wall biosynthesis
MLIGIDGNEANVSNRVGSNVYAYEILKYLHGVAKIGNDVRFRVYLKDSWQTLLPTKQKNWQYSVFGPKLLWTQWRLPVKLFSEKLKKSAPSLFFTPGHYAPRFSPVPTVITIMDLAYLKFPNEFKKKDLRQLTSWTAYSIKKARHILTISESTKKDIIETYGVNPDNITVTYPGISRSLKTEKDNSYQHLSAYLGIIKPYILYIGTLQPRKNLERLIEAFANLKKDSQNRMLKLVVVGKKGWLYQSIFTKVKELKVLGEVIFTGFVSDYEKFELLRYAEVFVLPSLYEGFGIPVLEAMTAGVPVLASKVSSLPEVGGDAISYISNPESVVEIEKKLSEVLQLSEDKKLEIINKQKRQAQKFSWERCGEKTLDVLLNVSKNI